MFPGLATFRSTLAGASALEEVVQGKDSPAERGVLEGLLEVVGHRCVPRKMTTRLDLKALGSSRAALWALGRSSTSGDSNEPEWSTGREGGRFVEIGRPPSSPLETKPLSLLTSASHGLLPLLRVYMRNDFDLYLPVSSGLQLRT